MRRMGTGFVLGALVGASQPVLAAAPPIAVATSGWQVDYGDQRCLAGRRYTVGKTAFTFAVEPDTDGRGARFIVRPDRAPARAFPGWHKARLTLDGAVIGQDQVIWPDQGGGMILLSGSHQADDEALLPLASARTLTLESSALSAVIPLGPMAKVMPLLDDCNAGLLASWGFSKADQARLAVKPQGKLLRFFNPNDYPPDSLKRGRQGEVAVRFAIGADGKASGCAVRMTSGDPALDRATCTVIDQRVRFTPARDKAGQAMAVVDTARVRWVMPGF